jgi:nitrate/nitrite transporter NarK
VFVILLSLAWFIHTKRLSPWIAGLGVELTQIICYILLITIKKPVAKFVFVMIATAASQSFFPIIWPERIRAARGTTTAGLAIGITNASCQLMGIVGPQIYQPKFGPTYRVSYVCSIALLATCVGAVSTTWFFVMRDDRKRARMVDDDAQSPDSGPDEGKNAVIQS